MHTLLVSLKSQEGMFFLQKRQDLWKKVKEWLHLSHSTVRRINGISTVEQPNIPRTMLLMRCDDHF